MHDLQKILKEVFFVLLFAILLISCNEQNESTNLAASDSMSITQTDRDSLVYHEKSTGEFSTVGFYIWEVDVEKKTLKKNPNIDSLEGTQDLVISGLNAQYPEIKLEKVKQLNDTLFLKIADSDYFTNQIGSSGAAQYIAQAVINLTAVPGVTHVHIDFEMGSHATPDTWSRKDFPGYILIP